MPIFVVSLDPAPQDENEAKEAQVSDTEITLGRSFLGFECDDRRISRSHGLLVRGEDKVTIKATHENPIYFKRSLQNNVETIIKESQRELGHGDAFGLLREKFWYKIKVHNEPINGGTPVLRIRAPVELNLSQNLPQILAEVSNGSSNHHQQPNTDQAPQPNCDINPADQQLRHDAGTPDLDLFAAAPEEPATTSNEVVGAAEPPNPLKRPATTWTQACSQSIDSTTDGNDEPNQKKSKDNEVPQPQVETGEASQAPVDREEEILPSPVEHGEATPAPQTSNDATSNAAPGSSNSTNDAGNSVDVKPAIKKEEADSSVLRDSCEFGIRCYR